MKKEWERKFYWRKLDDQAKVFALASNRNYSSIFRLSVILREKVDSEILQKALEMALEKYKIFKVKLKHGLFWYYFEENKEKPIVSIEKEYPFKKINTKENNNYLFKITYFEKKINIDFFHALTDGNGGAEFLKEIIYRYLEIKYSKDFYLYNTNKIEVIKECENAYKRNYKRYKRNNIHFRKAYMLSGDELPKGYIGINHFNINLKDIKGHTKKKACSLSMYLVAMIAYSIYEANYKKNNKKEPINLCIPINLKKYFKTETLSNFFSYMVINLNLKKEKIYTFDDILSIVKNQFEKKLKVEKIIQTMTLDAGTTNNLFVRFVPLIIKKLAVRIGSLEVKRHFTMTISNVGQFQVNDKYKEYIDNFLVVLAPDWAEKVKCGICSYGDKLVVTFGSLLKENSIESIFKDILVKNNINFTIEGNGVNVISD